MLNEERIILMTKMAAYEKGKGKQHIYIGKYFRSDYIAIQLLKAAVCWTLAFIMVLLLFIVYNFETFMHDIYEIDLIAFGKDIFMYYGITLIGYEIICYAIGAYRYFRAKKHLKSYYQDLKKLNSL